MILVALNGFTNRDTRTGICGIVRSTLDTYRIRPAVTLHHMGGGGFLVFRKLAKRIEGIAREGQGKGINRLPLVLIGKSYGGHWCRRLLWRLARKDLLDGFDPIKLVAVDPQFGLVSLVRTAKRVPDSVRSTCFRQAGFMGGYAIEPGHNELIEATHGGSHHHPKVLAQIAHVLTTTSAPPAVSPISST